MCPTNFQLMYLKITKNDHHSKYYWLNVCSINYDTRRWLHVKCHIHTLTNASFLIC